MSRQPIELPILTTDHAARKLRSRGFLARVALDTWQTQVVTRGDRSVRVTAMRADDHRQLRRARRDVSAPALPG